MAVQTYRDLLVWQKAMDLVVEVYQLTKSFPADERFGLTTQIQRAVVSIPANIAEGYGRLHRRDYVRHLSFARGSLVEAETHLQIAVRLNYITRDEGARIWHQFQEIGRLLSGLIRSLNGSADQALPDP
ncbi:MAG: four helix bundle protein [Pirellulales bacterium]